MINVRHKQPVSETEKYIDKLPSLEDKFEMYMEVQLFVKACDIAIKLKDGSKLQEVSLT